METARDQVQAQYRDASNLAARVAIYRFADPAATPWPRWVFEQLDLPARAMILEIGCGDGGLWKRNLDRLPPAWRVTMLDLSAGMLHAARGALPAAQFAFLQGDAERLPFADGRASQATRLNGDVRDAGVDAVVANHMLYHLPDRVRALREIRRVLVPGGRLLATTNSQAHLAPMTQLMADFLGHASPLRGEMPFSLENGAAQIRAAGFDDIDLRSLRGELRVTDAEAVVSYVMSVNEAPQLIVGEKRDALRRRASDEIDRSGAFIFPTAAGMFVATRQ